MIGSSRLAQFAIHELPNKKSYRRTVYTHSHILELAPPLPNRSGSPMLFFRGNNSSRRCSRSVHVCSRLFTIKKSFQKIAWLNNSLRFQSELPDFPHFPLIFSKTPAHLASSAVRPVPRPHSDVTHCHRVTVPRVPHKFLLFPPCPRASVVKNPPRLEISSQTLSLGILSFLCSRSAGCLWKLSFP
jgi:hypothetical protein